MKYNDDAQLDTSQVEDARSGGGGLGGGLGGLGGMLGGGGLGGGLGRLGGGAGVIGVIIFLALQFFGGGGGVTGSALGSVLGGVASDGGTVDNSQLAKECKTGADANKDQDCALIADINSIQAYWKQAIGTVTIGPKRVSSYTTVPTRWFSGQVQTGCGAADSGAGPFYCPADKKVFIDLSFITNDVEKEFDTQDTPFINAYILAHEYGHHVQDLLGIESEVKSRSGAESDSVRLELQADCFAGVWANHAVQTGLVSEITDQDISSGVSIAGKIGDDWIQSHLGGGNVDQSTFTHGSSAQRQKWLTTGYQTGDPNQCDTFSTQDLG